MKVLGILLGLQLQWQLLSAFKTNRSDALDVLATAEAEPVYTTRLSAFRARGRAQLRQHRAESSKQTDTAQILRREGAAQHELVPAPHLFELLSSEPLLLPLGSSLAVTGGTARDVEALETHVLKLGQFQVAPSAGVIIELKSEPVPTDGVKEEAYRIEVADSRISLVSPSSHGLFNAMMTLRQLMKAEDGKIALPALRIEDAPKHEWRGLMLDVSRHFFDAAEVKHLLRTMALVKLNRFHWHLSDDQGFRVPVAKYPRLTAVGAWRDGTQNGHSSYNVDHQRYGGSYTAEEVRDVVAYAKALHIEVVPETDLPGHAQAILAAYPEFSNQDAVQGQPKVMKTWGVSEYVLAPNDKTFTFVSDLVEEVSDLIPSDYYHVGGDEVSAKQWDTSATAQEYEQDHGLQSSRQIAGIFTQKAIQTLNRLGRSGVVWDEALSTGVPLPPNSVVMIWRDWDNVPVKLHIASKRGMRVVMCPHSATYLDFAQGPTDPYESQQGVVDLQKVYNMALDGHGAHVLGGQGQLWSEYISRGLDDLDFKAWPRGAAIAEATWCDQRRLGFEDFKRRVKARSADFEELGVELHID